MLIDQGYAVIEAESADEAAALAAELDDIRLVLSDIRLRGSGTGIDLKARLAGRDLPCILMTSLPVADPLYRAAQAQGPVLRKPFTAAQLSALIHPKAAP
jgi:DNA-binding NtrC family response regulator